MLDESDAMNDENRPFSGTDIDARIAELSPDKRALLLKRISHGNKDLGGSPVLRARTRAAALSETMSAECITSPRRITSPAWSLVTFACRTSSGRTVTA